MGSVHEAPMEEVPARDHHLTQGSSTSRLILLPGGTHDESSTGEGGSATADGSEETDPNERDFAAKAPIGHRKPMQTDREIFVEKDIRRGNLPCSEDTTYGKNPKAAGVQYREGNGTKPTKTEKTPKRSADLDVKSPRGITARQQKRKAFGAETTKLPGVGYEPLIAESDRREMGKKKASDGQTSGRYEGMISDRGLPYEMRKIGRASEKSPQMGSS